MRFRHDLDRIRLHDHSLDNGAQRATRDGRVNVYFTINSTRGRVYRKPRKTQIATLDALHVDVDPRAGRDLDGERAAILARLRAVEPAPTVIWDSGRGYWALWALAEPIKLAANVAEVDTPLFVETE